MGFLLAWFQFARAVIQWTRRVHLLSEGLLRSSSVAPPLQRSGFELTTRCQLSQYMALVA
eukprot:CAMPEP_0172842250 /NCGR_PEP_ID=MMETSP1075-20121228/30591_1 /TAXON_ID=2916 /ORGANISM="Ceratium fusus, Strain PA161109" /LENGTH=59 /DNA_ID=CAMNT_0013686341 /DNA_START=309 /DNA_END=484 /DNA_ORIENTATION=+